MFKIPEEVTYFNAGVVMNKLILHMWKSLYIHLVTLLKYVE